MNFSYKKTGLNVSCLHHSIKKSKAQIYTVFVYIYQFDSDQVHKPNFELFGNFVKKQIGLEP